MKPAPFDYIAPATISAALATLAEAGGGATVIAGGQTLMPLLNLRMSQPFILVDINKTAGMTGITHSAAGTRIGAATRQAALLTNPELAEKQPVLVEAARHIGHHQTRNRGTVGGSVALGEPAAELPATMVALGAELEVHSVKGERRIRADEFYLGPYMTVLEPDELLVAIHMPAWPVGGVTIFREVARRPGDFALVGLVGALQLDSGKIVHAGLAWLGMGPTPIKARQAEAALLGQMVDAIDPVKIAELAIADTEPFEDHHATADYRRRVGTRIFGRALAEALNIPFNAGRPA
ncbi:MAG: xanthine dehydrogenase family protein subunit [Novosphingobium sp.]|nr:xanthine dehydrogenase family protein subunit [Novosphingobium sp.]